MQHRMTTVESMVTLLHHWNVREWNLNTLTKRKKRKLRVWMCYWTRWEKSFHTLLLLLLRAERFCSAVDCVRRLLGPWAFPSKNTGVAAIFSSGIFPARQGLNLHPCTGRCIPSPGKPRLLCPWNIQARTRQWAAVPFSAGSSQPRDWAWVSRLAGGLFTVWVTSTVLCVCAQ